MFIKSLAKYLIVDRGTLERNASAIFVTAQHFAEKDRRTRKSIERYYH